MAAREAGITLLVVGVDQSGRRLSEWLGVASFPAKFNVFDVGKFDQLATIVSRLVAVVGNGKVGLIFAALCSKISYS